MINLFDPISPVDARIFDLDEMVSAQAWMCEGTTTTRFFGTRNQILRPDRDA